MQGLLYYPAIRVPESAWFTGALLYWDSVATIVPHSWFDEPEQLGHNLQDLVGAGLVVQFSPYWANSRQLVQVYSEYIDSLAADELADRRRRLTNGEMTLIHREKWVDVRQLERTLGEGLAIDSSRHGQWIQVESKTAIEFMSALALSLCSEIEEQAPPEFEAARGAFWTPGTDKDYAIEALVRGLEPDPGHNSNDDLVFDRVAGELESADIRSFVLREALPIPDHPLPVDEIVAFRRRHGHRLSAFRRQLESRIDAALSIDNAGRRQQFLDRLVEEIVDLREPVEAYLWESGVRRIRKSPLVSLLRSGPLVSRVATAAQRVASQAERGLAAETNPLAYLAFAETELKLASRYRTEKGLKPLSELLGP